MKTENNYITLVTDKPRPLPIKPPRSNKKKSNETNQPCYSLFDTVSAPFNWLDERPPNGRKHSVSVDGSDTLKYENKYAGFWRRASLPNKQEFLNSSSCAVCNLHIYPTNNNICDHSICQHCITLSSCPLCPKELMSSPSSITSSSTSLFNHLPSPDPYDSFVDLIYPQQDEKFYIGDLLSPSTSFDSIGDTKHEFYCVKLANIPWDVSQKDIKLFFKDFELPCESIHAQSIHIMMDRMTGKTLSDCYIEFLSESEAQRATEYGNQRALKNRIVSATLSSHQEFLEITFPKWATKFTGNQANPAIDNNLQSFVTHEEISSLLTICKNYKLYFSRKCAERPFENIITIVTKYPWEQHALVTEEQRNSIYDLLKSSIDALKLHLSKVVHIDNSLLDRILRAGIMCPAFTDQQKSKLLKSVGYPLDIETFMLTIKHTDQHKLNQDNTQLDTSYVYVSILPPPPLSSGTLSLLDILNTFQTGKESDEDSYFFWEKEDIEDDQDSFYKV
ncbi:hypothetical protein BDF21DRAFT_494025 [Thamnidium elegans]|nr:hypothetical protein BDF21DRAFT_494025 [Thamnidium elegans]